MTRGEFINHLIEQDCFPDEEAETEYNQLWHNSINGETSNVPKEEYLEIPTWAHIVFELKIDPPYNRDSDYYVYRGWRDYHEKKMLKEKKEQ